MIDGILRNGIIRLVEGKNLDRNQMRKIMERLMTGNVPEAQASAFLVAMRVKGATEEEITGAVDVIRSLCHGVKVHDSQAVDIVGTGGDGASLFNVSTAAAFVCAEAGATVAKHGNRGFSSNSGSADVLERAGINIELNANDVALCIKKTRIGFMFAQHYHPAMRHLADIRKTLGFRTFMNLLGPLANPAGVKRLLLGVYEQELCLPVAKVLMNTGSLHVMVVHSKDGLDEISPAAKTFAVEAKKGIGIDEYMISPKDFGINYDSLNGLAVNGPDESLALIKKALGGGTYESHVKKAADMIALNAGAAIYLADKASTLENGVKKAQAIIHKGAALKRIDSLVAFSRQPGKSKT